MSDVPLPGLSHPRCRVCGTGYVTRAERGQTFVEYVMLLALLAVVVIIALNFLGPSVADIFDRAAQTLSEPSPAPDDDG